MQRNSEQHGTNVNSLTGVELERSKKANRIFRGVCKELEMNVCSWSSFKNWNAFVEGNMDEGQLYEAAKQELGSQSTAAPPTLESQDGTEGLEEDKKGRAKRANEIYRKVCSEEGVNPCFFHGFRAWSDFISGRINENEFYNGVKEEASALIKPEG